MRGWAAVTLFAMLSAGCLSAGQDPATIDEADATGDGRDDVVVVAVLDSGFNPYHWDFVSTFMPQHGDADATNDLPLGEDPATWLPGHPGVDAFASYASLNLTLNVTDENALTGGPGGVAGSAEGLHEKDSEQWGKVQSSTPEQVHMAWVPGTKVVGYVNFGNGDGFSPGSHGVGTTSVSVGNFHGSCPECLLVFVNGLSEDASRWIEQQDWIDLQTNSFGFSQVGRERLYAGSDTESQRAATERGQSIFFSAGNGVDGSFAVPNPTLWSSQEGPDWIVTVGAIHPTDGSSYSGHGKPADIAHIGTAYPSAYGTTTVNGTDTFGGTSNATPVTAGTYARALYLLRREMAEASRVQANGTISVGNATCGDANPDCAVGDGVLTVHELRAALFRSAEYTDTHWRVAVSPTIPFGTEETEYVAEGHGSMWGHMRKDGQWWQDSDRVAGFALGTWHEEQDPLQVAWMVADSYCRQSLWGAWDHGYWTPDVALPPSDPAGWPMRTWLRDECPERGPLLLQAIRAVESLPAVS